MPASWIMILMIIMIIIFSLLLMKKITMMINNNRNNGNKSNNSNHINIYSNKIYWLWSSFFFIHPGDEPLTSIVASIPEASLSFPASGDAPPTLSDLRNSTRTNGRDSDRLIKCIGNIHLMIFISLSGPIFISQYILFISRIIVNLFHQYLIALV